MKGFFPLCRLIDYNPVENRAWLEFAEKKLCVDTSTLPVERVLPENFVTIVGELFVERDSTAGEVRTFA